MDSRRRLHLFLLVALAAVTYLPALDGAFLLWDDQEFVEHNPLVRPLDGQSVRDIFTPARIGAVEGIYIPLTDLSLALDRTLFGPGPRGFHATNIALHVLATVLLYFCFLRVPLSSWGAFVAAAVFAVHPIHVESVAWLSCRKDVLSMAFFAGACLLAMDAALVEGRRAPRAALAALLFACAVLAKPTTVVLPALVLIWAATRGRARASMPAVVPLALLALGGVALQVWMGRQHGVVRGEVFSGLDHRLLQMARVFPRYLLNLVFPTGLSARYDWSGFGSGFDAATKAALASCGAFAAMTFLSVRSAPRLCLGLAWVFVALLPVAQIVPTGLYMADKYMHIPSIGASLLFGLAVGEFTTARAWVLGLLLATFGALTWARCEEWRDTRTLLADAMARSPRSVDANYYLARAYKDAGEIDRAVRALRRTQAIDPGYFGTYYTLGKIELERGNPDGAESLFQQCLLIQHKYHPGFFDLSVVRTLQHRDAEAEDLLRTAIQYAPQRVEYRVRLVEILRARALGKEGRAAAEAALAAADAARDAGARSPDLSLQRGCTLLELGRPAEAEVAFREGIAMDGARIELRGNLAKVLIDRKSFGEAREHVLAGLAAMPQNAMLRFQLGLVDFRQGRFEDAVAAVTQALASDPRSMPARLLLARSYDSLRDAPKALAAWKGVLELAPDHVEGLKRVGELEKR